MVRSRPASAQAPRPEQQSNSPPSAKLGSTPGSVPETIASPPAVKHWERRHILDLDDFTAEEIELVLDTADAMKEVLARDVPRVPALRGTTVVTLFYEA